MLFFAKRSQLAGFEPTQAEPIGFQVQRLNHSATTAHHGRGTKTWRCGGSNPGPFTCKANALPLSYIPLDARVHPKSLWYTARPLSPVPVRRHTKLYPRGDSNPQSSV